MHGPRPQPPRPCRGLRCIVLFRVVLPAGRPACPSAGSGAAGGPLPHASAWCCSAMPSRTHAPDGGLRLGPAARPAWAGPGMHYGCAACASCGPHVVLPLLLLLLRAGRGAASALPRHAALAHCLGRAVVPRLAAPLPPSCAPPATAPHADLPPAMTYVAWCRRQAGQAKARPGWYLPGYLGRVCVWSPLVAVGGPGRHLQPWPSSSERPLGRSRLAGCRRAARLFHYAPALFNVRMHGVVAKASASTSSWTWHGVCTCAWAVRFP